MSRQARQYSEYLHLIVRGIGKQSLFEDGRDRKKYMELLIKYREETGISILACCLMENHVHLLVRDAGGIVPVFMKKMGVSYAQYYNRKYERSGHLFLDRYKSKIIREDAYLLTVYRYILNNPQKAGLCAAKDDPWAFSLLKKRSQPQAEQSCSDTTGKSGTMHWRCSKRKESASGS